MNARCWIYLLLSIVSQCFAETITWQSEAPPPFSIAIKIEREETEPTGPIYFKAVFIYPSAYALNVDPLPERLTWNANPLAPPLRMDSITISPLAENQGIKSQTFQAEIAPLITGSVDISLLEIIFTTLEEGKPLQKIITPAFKLVVEAPSASTFADLPLPSLAPLNIQFPIDLSYTNRELIEGPHRLATEMERNRQILDQHAFPWLTLVVLLSVGILSWGAYLIHKQLEKRPAQIPQPIDPLVQAHSALDNLQQPKELLNQDQLKAFYGDLTGIAAIALEKITGRQTAGLTSQELLLPIEKTDAISPDEKQKLRTFFAEADQIKFANKIASQNDATNALEMVRQLVQTHLEDNRSCS